MAECFDVMVVGTGFGGSVSAARLAEGGMRVLMLERGPWWGPAGEELARDRAVRRPWPRGVLGSRKFVRSVRVARGRRSREHMLAKDGLFELHRFEHLSTLTGSGVGGGSLIYTNIQAEPPRKFFDAFPNEIDANEMAPYYQRVRSVLRPRPLPHRPDKNRAFEEVVDEISETNRAPTYPDLAVAWGEDPGRPQAHVNAAGITQTTCNHCGECVLGCPSKAKTTLDLTYVALALQAGAELRALSEVIAIGERPKARGGGFEVRYIDHGVGEQRTARAKSLVLAAGTLNTLRLLFSARDRHRSLERLPVTLGHGFSSNADLPALLVGAGAHLHDSSKGPAFNAFLSEQGESGAARYLVGEAGLPLSALPLPKIVQRWLGTSAVLWAMGADASTGTVGFDGEFLRNEAGREIDPALFEEIEAQTSRLSAAYRPKISWINGAKGRSGQGLVSVHPLGGAGLADHPGDGVVDHRGEVFGHPGLHVADGSIFPRAPGVPPSMTIAALAERQASLMLE